MKNIMVCVTLQNTCERLIKKASSLLPAQGGQLFVLHVAKTGHRFMGSDDNATALEYLFDVSHQFGADMTVLYSDDVLKTIADFIEGHGIDTVVLGAPARGEQDNNVLRRLAPLVSPGVEWVLCNKQEL